MHGRWSCKEESTACRFLVHVLDMYISSSRGERGNIGNRLSVGTLSLGRDRGVRWGHGADAHGEYGGYAYSLYLGND